MAQRVVVRKSGNCRGTIYRAPTRVFPYSRIIVLRETHDTPESVAQRLERAGGRNLFGEPNYRAIWGWNRLAWIGGKFEERDAHGALLRERIDLRLEPKYPQLNRWHIERWVPPEVYGSPRAWYAQTVEIADGRSIPALGPYPSRGDYEHCFTLEGPNSAPRSVALQAHAQSVTRGAWEMGEFVQLTPTVAERIAHAIEWSRRQPRVTRRAALEARERQNDCQFDNLAYSIFDDAVPAFHKQRFVTVL